MTSKYPVPEDTRDYRQCCVCDYITSDAQARAPVDEVEGPWPCPSCKDAGGWNEDIDWTTRDRAMEDLYRISQELDLPE